ncbi:NDP-hexose 2,3-dehydratase family protein [Kitasatospora sp. NPDC001119]
MPEAISDVHTWLAERTQRNEYRVSRTPLDQLDGWCIDPVSGDITHHSGRFFSVRGVEVETDHRDTKTWTQPIILQPEIGILGITVRRVGDQVQCLMQAKMEPGNVNLVQLSPTVQATRSNYTRAHGGSPVPYLEHFTSPRDSRVVYDALQSEQGSWFLDKRNRNMIVEVAGELPLHDDFRWIGTDQLAELMKTPNLVNMDARTVLAGLPFFDQGGPGADEAPLHSVGELLSWFTEARSRYHLNRRLVPLAQVPHWVRSPECIAHEEDRHFSVIGVAVQATNREVGHWSQPMLEPVGRGVIGFLGRHIDGVFHLLVQARTEAGTGDIVEMAPTVSCIPANYAGTRSDCRPRYLDEIEWVPQTGVLVDVIHSEEGGRFFQAENRYLVVDVGEDFGLDVPDDFCWMTPRQLTRFVRYGNHVNVAARCLLSCLTSRWRNHAD